MAEGNACGAYCYPTNVGLDTCNRAGGRVQSRRGRVQCDLAAFPGKKSAESATFALETRINK